MIKLFWFQGVVLWVLFEFGFNKVKCLVKEIQYSEQNVGFELIRSGFGFCIYFVLEVRFWVS